MILITGASGFVGSALVQELIKNGRHITKVAVRKPILGLPDNISQIVIENLDKNTNWCDALKDVKVVIHAAARAHIVNDNAKDSMAEFRKINVDGTLNLAKKSLEMGVGRFIYISSIKVNGENTELDMPFKASDQPAPCDEYGISKYEAEQGLQKMTAGSRMDVVIIRPSLVYGPGVKANFLSMMQWIEKGVPLPLGAIHNQRSLVALDTLVDFIITCIEHPAAANQVFMVSDGEDLSTTELLIRMGHSLGKPVRLLSIPQSFIIVILQLLGKESIARRLCNSLQVDITKNWELLGWIPINSVEDALKKTAEFYLAHGSKKNDSK